MSHQPARNDPYQLVTDSILAHLERGVVPWRCPWNRTTGRPRNFHTGRDYHGVNVLLLGLLHFPSPWWMTFRQAQERAGCVRKGEHGAIVMKFGRYDKALKNGDGTEDKKTTLFLKSYRVFNATQIEGIEFPPVPSGPQLDASQRITGAEQIVAQMPQPPTISEGRTAQACYRRQSHTIEMPAFARFDLLRREVADSVQGAQVGRLSRFDEEDERLLRPEAEGRGFEGGTERGFFVPLAPQHGEELVHGSQELGVVASWRRLESGFMSLGRRNRSKRICNFQARPSTGCSKSFASNFIM